VLVPFPFSDLSHAKLRPALVLACAGQGDWILCQITSNPYADLQALRLVDAGFISGSLARESFLRPGKLFTAHQSLIVRSVGQIKAGKLLEAKRSLVRLLK
jgi:mRNA interferase MazF